MLSFKQQPYEADITPRWSVGVDKRHVAVYVVVAVVAGFALGFIVARSLVRKDSMAALPPGNSSPAPSREAAQELQPTEFHPVTRILRADTVEVDGVGPVRMIGVETPDGKTPREIYAAHGQNALNFVEKSLLNQDVRLEFDPANAGRNKDESGQTLAYVYTRDGTLINSEIIKQGLGFVRTSDQFKLSESFRAQERDAMQSMRGVWGSSASAATAAAGGAAQPASAASPGAADDKPRRLSPLAPSAIGPNIPAIAGSPAASTSEPSVFVSPDDKIYHKAGCELLGKKRQAMPVSEARSKGYAACSRCFASTVMKAP
jgi:endonuclease YncB( thermonuclease family)